MDIFYTTLQQMLTMFFLMSLGYILRKSHILPPDSDTAMARLETYIFVPALSLSNLLKTCTPETFSQNSSLILYGAVLSVASILLAYPLSRLFVRKTESRALRYQRNVYKYAMAFSNFGFMGNFIILAVWGDEFFFKYQMFYLVASILCNSWGLYVLIPKAQNEGVLYNLKKGLISPPMLAIALGILLGLLNCRAYVPAFLLKAFENAGQCQGPVAMVLAGFVIGGYNVKEIFVNKKVYFASLVRLIFIPAAILLSLKAFGASKEVLTLSLIFFATPFGLNTIVFPAAYGGDTKTGAAMATISSTASVLTIPLMYLLFILFLT